MPLGKTETMSSMAGPNSTTYYDRELVDLFKEKINNSDFEVRKVTGNPTLSDIEKFKAIEKINNDKVDLQDQLKKYSNDPAFRDKYRKTMAKERLSYISPEWDKLKDTEVRTNPSRILDLEKPATTSKAMKGSWSGITSVGFGDEPVKETPVPKNRAEYLANQPDATGASVRTRNFLANNVQSMEDFMKLTENKIRGARNVGSRNWTEIKAIQDKIKKDPKSWGFYRQQLEIPGLEYSTPKKLTPPPMEQLLPKGSGSTALSVAKGLGKAVVSGLVEAPKYEFLNPPSAGPSDPNDPVYQFERGLISQAEFNRRMGK
jgi:hypothetical protein